MKRIMRRDAEMKRPDYKICQYCGERAGREEKICPACGRLTVRNLRAEGSAELLAEERETYLPDSEKHRGFRISFDQIAEEREDACVTGNRF